MTLLGILFVLGVAFMATMNFESQMMVSQSQRHNSDKSAGTMSDDMSGMMGGMMMGSPSVAFSTPSVVDSHGVYAEIPGVQNSVSSIEPLPNPGVDGIIDGFGPGTNDIRNDSTLTAYVNPSSVRGITSSPAPPPPGARDSRPLAVVLNSDPRAKDFVILTAVPPGFQLQCWPATCSKRCTDYGNDCANAGDCKNGDCRVLNLQRCISGPNDGLECADNGDCNPPGVSTFSCEGLRLLDADGDGVSDSIAVDARDFGFTDTQLATLGPQLNPKSKPNGRVSVAFRIVPHGGMVDLNSAHPKLIENALTVPDLHITADVAYGNFKHGPSGPARGLPQYAYPPESEERLLRRRNVLAPLSVAPSRLLGNSFAAAGASNVKTFQGDMPWQLLGPKPGGAASGNYQSVDPSDPFSHRYWPYSFQVVGNGIEKEAYSRSMQDVSAWEAKMEPNAAAVAEPATASDPLPAYNRNHLVTALSYDGLLQRGGRWGSNPNSSPADDLIARMASANFTASDPDCVAVQQSTLPLQLHVLPFEYPDYPDSIVDECCVTDPACKLNPRKGRLQLSLESLQSTCSGGPNAGKTCRNNSANQKSGGCGAPGICRGILVPPDPTNLNLANLAVVEFYHRMQRVVYDVFAMLLNNALSTPYFADISCNPSGANPDVDCSAGEYCDAPVGATAGVCRDVWTNQRHSINQLTRTAASLTANLIDYADADDNPTRIAIRDLDFNEADPRCDVGANAGQVCKLGSPSDCPGGVCVDKRNQLGREVRTCDGGSKANKVCQNTGDCLGGQCINLHYMYGVEKQPFITEVATYADNSRNPSQLLGRAVELFNPFPTAIDLNNTYFLYQVNAGATTPGAPIPLNASLPPGGGAAGSFATFITADATTRPLMLPAPALGVVVDLTGASALTFNDGATLYLVRRFNYPGDPTSTDIVVDQFTVKGDTIAKSPCTNSNGICNYTLERDVEPPQANAINLPWRAAIDLSSAVQPKPPVPAIWKERIVNGPVDSGLGTWTNPNLYGGTPKPQPVEVFLSNSGMMGGQLTYGGSPPAPIVPAFPTTGSMLFLMRHANRAISDFYNAPPPPGTARTVKNLAFTTRLAEAPAVKLPNGTPANPPNIFEWLQIDNGRLPLFDIGTDGTATPPALPPHNAAHHILPSTTPVNAPGELNTLPWGQLVFDYFTALPLNNPGPYFDTADPANDVAAPESQPRVDLDGLRVQGRININAAPWKVLEGLPFRPMQYFPLKPTASTAPLLGDRIKAAIYPPLPSALTPADAEAGVIGESLAKSIVAYRDLRAFAGTGNYAPQLPLPAGSTTPPFGRGWLMKFDPNDPPNTTADPMWRRGTGFQSVGELANVRHPLSAGNTNGPRSLANYAYRFDAGNIDPTGAVPVPPAPPTDYLSAIATLVALGDWVTVRSDVFTVYGVMRGEDDLELATNPQSPTLAEKMRMSQDANSRAIRFQETIDRLPTLLGAPKPQRIGERTISNYADFRND